jgi:hypothetical protein
LLVGWLVGLVVDGEGAEQFGCFVDWLLDWLLSLLGWLLERVVVCLVGLFIDG